MFGAWHFIHGNGGNLEETETVTALRHKGWGLSFYQRAGTVNWLHYAVPSFAQYNWCVDFLRLKFTTGPHAYVREIHLWDGNVQFWSQATEYGAGEIDVEIPLGKEWEINRGLGISIKLETDGEGDGSFIFHAVGANFRQLPTGVPVV